MTVQLIEIYFRTLKYARAGNTCCSLSRPSSICQKSTANVRVIHTQMIKISRLHATVVMSRIAVETMREKGEKSIFILNIYKRIHTGSLQNVFKN